ncbi:MAG TPA: ATP-binding cassette domain-containing protein, partial [Burkholderiaceae bacterium]|nr:ATP-binding cassette domain-containing protein [Burkholderiaceae bacterium]
RGETLFLCGGNGSGKSTLLMLLCGLLTPGSGIIRVDGDAVDERGAAPYRNRFAAVFFDFTLFRHVIDADAGAASPAAVASWLQRMQLHEKVGYHEGCLTSLDLSQGQRKRLALLQACLDDRDILVLDEITADQDSEFREHFYVRILPELKRRGKTVILVTHDDRYWHHADRLVVLDCGRAFERPVPLAAAAACGVQ